MTASSQRLTTTDGAEIEALAGSNHWEQNEPYTIVLLIKDRSGDAGAKHPYDHPPRGAADAARSNSSSNGNHIMWLSFGATPDLRHEASGGGTLPITSFVAIVNDTTSSGPGDRHASSCTWAASRGPRVRRRHQCLVRHLPLGLGLLDLAGLQRRHRPDRVLRLALDPRHGAALARRSVLFSAPMERGAGALWQRATRHATLDRHRRSHLLDGVDCWNRRGSGDVQGRMVVCLLSRLPMSQEGVQRRPARFDASVAPGAKPAPFPGFVEPSHPTLREMAPSGERWAHEIKFEGYRT